MSVKQSKRPAAPAAITAEQKAYLAELVAYNQWKNTPIYSVICNTAGYLPDSAPSYFLTRQEAERYMLDEKAYMRSNDFKVTGSLKAGRYEVYPYCASEYTLPLIIALDVSPLWFFGLDLDRIIPIEQVLDLLNSAYQRNFPILPPSRSRLMTCSEAIQANQPKQSNLSRGYDNDHKQNLQYCYTCRRSYHRATCSASLA